MLNALHIENIAVIEKADIEFNKGFNVLTGETGAGKSIIIDSINAILGERTSKDLVRTGADGALVSALFSDLSNSVKNKLKELGYDVEDELLITKRLSENKSSIKINGAPATAGLVKNIAGDLINIHGQHDSQSLLSKETHITFLDLYAKNDKLLSEYKQVFQEFVKIKKELDKQIELSQTDKNKEDALRYAVEELSEAEIEVGERDKLKAKRDLIVNSENIVKLLSQIKQIMDGDDDTDGVIGNLSNTSRLSEEAEKFLPEISGMSQKLSGFSFEVEELSRTINDKISGFDYNLALLEQIEARLDYLYKLSLKYGQNEEDMIEYLENAKKELGAITSREYQISALQDNLDDVADKLTDVAERLTLSRKTAGEKLSKSICNELEFLNMPKVKFIAQIEQKRYSQDGKDNVEFFISPNAGEKPKPLMKIASGGELSRIMLAIKSVLAENDGVDSLIFDEIDSGISGNAAQKVGIKLKEIAKIKQVICVTHLVQIAALADSHYKIEKNFADDKTRTNIISLDREGRIDEVARIMSAGMITEANRKFAEELIDNK